MARVALGPADDLPPGTMKGFDVEGRKIILLNLDGTLYALGGICTHAYAELATGFFAGGSVTCPLHLSQFDVETGEALSPPATDPLARYEVTVEDGTVYVDLPEGSPAEIRTP